MFPNQVHPKIKKKILPSEGVKGDCGRYVQVYELTISDF